MILTLEQLKDMQPGIFDRGTTTDNADGANMTGSGQHLKWVAVRGQIHDWAIYCHTADKTDQYIRDMGDKIHDRSTVKKLVPCDSDALGMYRD